ncbi:MAG: aryl-sulfate sulfotransferase [Azospirillum sp.]|nr:aryl-sulfate sulfotransferase [Azospirillum sp.]
MNADSESQNLQDPSRATAGDRRRLRKHSVVIAGHPTSVSLEIGFWEALKEIAAAEGVSLNALVAAVDRERTANLSSSLRVYVLDHLRRSAGKI